MIVFGSFSCNGVTGHTLERFPLEAYATKNSKYCKVCRKIKGQADFGGARLRLILSVQKAIFLSRARQ